MHGFCIWHFLLFMFFSAHVLSLIYVSRLMNSLSSFLLPYASFRQSPCLPCSVVLIPGEDQVLEEGSTHNGCHDDHKTNSSKVSLSSWPGPDFQLLKKNNEKCSTFFSLNKSYILCTSSYFSIKYWCFILVGCLMNQFWLHLCLFIIAGLFPKQISINTVFLFGNSGLCFTISWP